MKKNNLIFINSLFHISFFALIFGFTTPSIILGQSFTRILLKGDNGWSEGGSWVDYDNDGDLDIFIPNNRRSPNTNFLYNNNNGEFTKVTEGIIISDVVMSESGTWGDYDNDGDLDLFTGDGGFDRARNNNLYQNNGDGSFTKISDGAIVSEASFSTSSGWADYDNDGDLDLFCANVNGFGSALDFLFRNDGEGVFTKITSGPLVTTATATLGMSWADYDNDNDLDIFVGNINGVHNLYNNEGNGNFTKMRSDSVGSIASDANSWAGSWGDYDNNGFLDLFVTTVGGSNVLYQNGGDGTFNKIAGAPFNSQTGPSNGSAWGDFDNDGDLDLFVAQGSTRSFSPNYLNINNGDGTFTQFNSDTLFGENEVSEGVAWGDYDKDGDLDLFVSTWNGGLSSVYQNDLDNSNNWINIKCVGVQSNRSAIGTKVRVKANIDGSDIWQMREISSQTGYNSQNSLNVHFGLGDATIIDSVRIEWPSGAVDIYTNVSANEFREAIEQTSFDLNVTSVKEYNSVIPDNFALNQNYPNPFNPSTNISYSLPARNFVTLKVHDILGKEVQTLINEIQQSGTYTIDFNAGGLSSGVYFYSLQIGDTFSKTKKMLLIR